MQGYGLYQRPKVLTPSCFPEPAWMWVDGVRTSIGGGGMVAIAVTRTDFTAAALRTAAVRADDTGVTRRALAVAMVLDGHPRATAAEPCGMERQTLRDWVHRFNAEGLEGLSDRRRPGRPALLSAERRKAVEAWVEAGPELAAAGVVRWRRIDLAERIKARFGVALDVRTVGRLLRKLDFRRISVRPQHPESDEAAQGILEKTLPGWPPPRSPRRHVRSQLKSGGRCYEADTAWVIAQTSQRPPSIRSTLP